MNDYVVVEKGGEIIPKIVDVLTSKRDVFSTTTRYIEFCPSCRTKLYRNEGDAKHYCPNILSCPPQIKGRFTHFISRKAMNIDSLGEETIELLIDKKIILNISDLYLLKAEDLLPFKKDGKKWAENIINGVARAIANKTVTYDLARVRAGMAVSVGCRAGLMAWPAISPALAAGRPENARRCR